MWKKAIGPKVTTMPMVNMEEYRIDTRFWWLNITESRRGE
jgi:hypothetical protein